MRTRSGADLVASGCTRRRVGVGGWRCQIRAEDDHGFVRRSGGSAWTGRIGNGTEDAAAAVTPDRRAGWLRTSTWRRAAAVRGRRQYVAGRARLTVDHHREWTADRAGDPGRRLPGDCRQRVRISRTGQSAQIWWAASRPSRSARPRMADLACQRAAGETVPDFGSVYL